MLRFDAVTFMAYLDNLRATEGVKSVWLFHSGGLRARRTPQQPANVAMCMGAASPGRLEAGWVQPCFPHLSSLVVKDHQMWGRVLSMNGSR